MFEESAAFDVFGLKFGSSAAAASANLTRPNPRTGRPSHQGRVQDQPLVQASLQETIGNVYLGLGMREEAESLLEESLLLRRAHLPREHLDVASSLHSIGVLRMAQYRFSESVTASEESLAIRRHLLGDDHELVDQSRVALGTLLGGGSPTGQWHDIPRFIELWRESVAWRKLHYGDKHRETAYAMLGLGGSLLWDPTRQAEAMKWVMEATPILRDDPISRTFGIAVTQTQQAELMGLLGQRSSEATATRRALVAAHETVDDVHPFMQFTKFKAIRHLIHAGQIGEAESLLEECLGFIRDHGFPPPVELIESTRYLADSIVGKDAKRAEGFCRQALELTQESLARPGAVATADFRGPRDRSCRTRLSAHEGWSRQGGRTAL